jgi:hypothetical protein
MILNERRVWHQDILLNLPPYKSLISLSNWSGHEDSNLGPPAPKAGALPGCAMPRLLIWPKCELALPIADHTC